MDVLFICLQKMNKQYVQFGQGLCSRGDSRPTINTTRGLGSILHLKYGGSTSGLFNILHNRTGGAWGAPSSTNYTDADLNQRHFMMRKCMSKPTIQTKIGLSTQQLAYMSQIDPNKERPNFLATTGTAGFYKNGTFSNINTNPYRKFDLEKGKSAIQKAASDKIKSYIQSNISKSLNSKTKGLYGNNVQSYSNLRNAINKCSTNGFYKKKKKSSKRTSRKKK